MREYYVRIPMAGELQVTVEANSEREAIDKAMGEVTIQNVTEWEPIEHINQGNVCYAPLWDVEVEDCGEVTPSL